MTEVHQDFGPLYPFSDFKKGEHVSYRVAGAMRQGEILWVSTGNDKVPPHYWILPDGDGDSFPDMCLLSDVVMEKQREPGMVEALEPCPYCYGQHPKGLIEQCPLKPH